MANCHNNILCVINQVFTVRHDNWNNEEGEVEARGCLCSISPNQKRASKNVTEIVNKKLKFPSPVQQVPFPVCTCPACASTFYYTFFLFHTKRQSWQLINSANGGAKVKSLRQLKKPSLGSGPPSFSLGKIVKHVTLWFVCLIPHERWIDFPKQAEIDLRQSSTAAKLSRCPASTRLCPIALSMSHSHYYSCSPASPSISSLDF